MRLLNPKDQDWLFEFSATAIKHGSSIRALASWADDGRKIVHLDALGRCSVFDTAIKDWHQVDLLPEWETTSIATSPDDLRVLCFGSHRSMPQNSEKAFLFEKEGCAETLVPRLEAEALCLGPNSVFRFDLHGLEILEPTSLLSKSKHYLGNAVWPRPAFKTDLWVEHSFVTDEPIVHSTNRGSVPLQDLIDAEIGHVNWSEFRFNWQTRQAILHLKKSEANSDEDACSATVLDLLDCAEIKFDFLTRWNVDANLVDLHFVPSLDLMLVAGAKASALPLNKPPFQVRICDRFATFPGSTHSWLEIADSQIRHVSIDESGELVRVDLVDLPCPSKTISSFEVSPDGQYFLVAEECGHVWVYDMTRH